MKPRASQAGKRASTMRAMANRRKSVTRKGDADGDELNEFGRPIDPRYFPDTGYSRISFVDLYSEPRFDQIFSVKFF